MSEHPAAAAYATRHEAGAGRSVRGCWPGDFILTHRDAWPSRLIAYGQRRRYRGADAQFAHWSHAAAVVSPDGDLVEALGHGVALTNLERYRDVEYHYVNLPMLDAATRRRMRRFALSCVGRPYGWVEITSLGLSLATGGGRFTFASEGTLICSVVVAEMLCRGDAIFPRPPERMMPADLAAYYGVTP